MEKRLLLTPGPTMVPPEVSSAEAQPIIHHRAPDFDPIFMRVQEGLKYVFQTQNPVVLLASSGTGAMECALTGTCSPGDKVICVEGGKFGERWTEIAKAFGMNPIRECVEWGTTVQAYRIKELLEQNPDTKAVCITHCETSTGVLTDIKAIAEVVSGTNAILIVDAVSSLGAEELHTDEWKIDIVVTGSQKALMLPPGLAFLSVSPRAREMAKQARSACYYFSLKAYLKNIEKKTTPYTPAISLILALDKSLEMIRKEGLENIWARHAKLSKAIQAGVQALGLKICSQVASHVVTPIWVPEGIDGKAIPKKLRDKYGVTIAGGQGQWEGKIIRIATLGYATMFDAT
ncbi:MAG: alanine--glyoxylate aminotransferase family protein, partial [Candidatus Sumerlaeota bacterium]|nr:alanine--glyoxylate aminotransferase family protein [Candidatus Sumerlaeota bacterium]